MEAENDSIAKAYEKKASDLEVKKVEMAEKIVKLIKTRPDFKGVFRTAFAFLANPYNLWLSDDFEDKRAVLKLVFLEKLSYDHKKGFRTVV